LGYNARNDEIRERLNAPIQSSDRIRAIEVLAKMHGWNAPEKTNLGEELKIERIEWAIVDPKNRDGVSPAAGEGEI
jgi:hypothetical protein